MHVHKKTSIETNQQNKFLVVIEANKRIISKP